MCEIAALQRPPAAAADTIENEWASVLNRLGHGRAKSPRIGRLRLHLSLEQVTSYLPHSAIFGRDLGNGQRTMSGVRFLRQVADFIDRPGDSRFSEKMHTSHHVDPFRLSLKKTHPLLSAM